MDKMLTQEQLQYMEDKVLEWNVLFGNDLNNENLIDTYINLCIEEGTEWLQAVKDRNHVEIIDAICDSVFTGFMLNRLQQSKGYGKWFEVEDLNYNIDVEALVNSLKGKYPDVFTYTSHLVCAVYCASKHYNIFEAFKRVSESNFSKAISKLAVENGEICLQGCISEVESAGRYEDVFIFETESHFLIKARKDLQEGKDYPQGKIIKGSWYLSVEDLGGLEEFIY